VRAADLSGEQRAQRDAVVSRLTAAGWDPGGWEELFEGGANLEPEAQLEYAGEAGELRLGFRAAERAFELDQLAGEDALSLVFTRADAGPVLDVIVAHQDTLSPDTLPDLVEAVMEHVGGAYLRTPDGLVKIEF
jgi:hypothetical protein